MSSWFKSSKRSNKHTYTPGRQRALMRRSYIFIALAVVVVLLALSQFGEDGLATYLKLHSYEKELVTDVHQLEQGNDALEEKLYGLANDPAVLEELAREEQNMRRRHEEVLTVFPETKEE